MKTKKSQSSFKVIIQKDVRAGTNDECYSSFVPELGISADGDSKEEVLASTKELIQFHLQCLSEEGEEIPLGNSANMFIVDMSIDLPS